MSQTKQMYRILTNRKEQGFTMLEVLVVVFILGILAAIAAPVWNGFINRQQVRVIQDRTYQALQSAKSEAKAKKIGYCAAFGITKPGAVVAFHDFNSSAQQWERLNPEISPGQIELMMGGVNDGTVCFDYKGNTDDVGATVYMQIPGVSSSKRCVIVQTLLGAIRKDEGSNCQAVPNSDSNNGSSGNNPSSSGNNNPNTGGSGSNNPSSGSSGDNSDEDNPSIGGFPAPAPPPPPPIPTP